MSGFIKQKLISIVGAIHLRIFGHEMSPLMQKFLGNLSISFFGGVIYSLLSFVFFVLAGRFLGPVDYGKYALYTALFSFLAIFLSFGLETSIVRLAAKADEEKKKRILSTFIIFFFCNSVFWSLIFIVFSKYIVIFFELPVLFIVFAILFSMTNSLGIALENYLKLLNQFVFINVIRIFQGCFLLFSLVLLYFSFNGRFSLAWFIALNIAASVFVLATFFFRSRNYFTFVFDGKILKELFLFSSSIFLGVISGYLIQNGTNVLIGKFIGARELGFYNAYYTLSVLAAGQLLTFFSAVYFPAIAQAENKLIIAKKIEKIFPMLGIVWFVLTALIMLIGLKLFGRAYIIDYRIVALFSFYALFNLYGSLFGFITISGGNRDIVRNLFLAWFLFVMLYFISLFILGSLGLLTLYGVVIAYAIIFFINALLNKYFCNKYLSNL